MIYLLDSTGLQQDLVISDAVLKGAFINIMKRFTHIIHLFKDTAVEQHTHNNLISRYTQFNIVFKSNICKKESAF